MQKLLRWAALAIGLAAVTAMPAATYAQIPPSAQDIAGYTGLHEAARTGNAAKLAKLLQARTDVDVRDPYQRTPLHVATYARQQEAIRMLAAARADLNAMEFQRYDAVTIAAVANDEETLALLLQLGATARNITSPYDGTALIAASHLGHAGVVKRLIAYGAPLDHINNLHWTALIEAIVLGDGGPDHTAVVRLLLEAGANPEITDREGNTPLMLASARRQAAIVQLLRQYAPSQK